MKLKIKKIGFGFISSQQRVIVVKKLKSGLGHLFLKLNRRSSKFELFKKNNNNNKLENLVKKALF